MTTKDFVIKWAAYGLALVPVWLLEAYLFSAIPVFGVKPMLLPLCAMAVAILEGSAAGAGFGLAVGVLFDAVIPGFPGLAILLMALLGLGAGLLAQYVLRQDFWGCLICSALALCAIDALRILARSLTGAAPLGPMLSLAGREIAGSLCFTPPVYLLFRWVFNRAPKATVL